MDANDPRHGTYAGAAAHWKVRERLCEPCRVAAVRQRKWNKYRALTGRSATVPAIGTVRRIQALQCLGWNHQKIADAAGISVHALRSPLVRGTWVYRSLAEAVAKAYDQLSMKVPPDCRSSRYCRTVAARHRWAPPLAWDDIDAPDAVPDLGAPDVRLKGGVRPTDVVLEDAEFLADDDLNLTNVLERLGLKRDTFHAACRREGRLDLYWRLANREPDADNLRAARAGLARAKQAVA